MTPIELLGSMQCRHGLPRPDWEAVWARVNCLPVSERAEAWEQVERIWQRSLADQWAKGFDCHEHAGCLLTTDFMPDQAHRLIRLYASSVQAIRQRLKRFKIDEDAVTGGSSSGLEIAIVCQNVEDYIDYISDVYPEEHQGAVSGGVCIKSGCIHVVAHGSSIGVVTPILTHEVAHSLLVHLPLPCWLEEGLVMLLEEEVTGWSQWQTLPEHIELHKGYWDAERLDRFFFSHAFCAADDNDGLTYFLAYAIARNLFNQSQADYRMLLLNASDADGGASACKDVMGGGLEGLLPKFIQESTGWRSGQRA